MRKVKSTALGLTLSAALGGALALGVGGASAATPSSNRPATGIFTYSLPSALNIDIEHDTDAAPLRGPYV